MLPVEIFTIQESLVLRARGSELLILPHHARQLQGLKVAKDFCAYFLDDALVNRPARKLFEAWLRKDLGLWKRIYEKVQNEMTFADENADADTSKTAKTEGGAAAKKSVEKKPVEKAKPVAKKVEATKTETKKTTEKPEKKAEKKPEIKTAEPKGSVKKTVTTKAAAPAEKKIVKKTATKSAAPVAKKKTATIGSATKTASKKKAK